MLQNKVKPTGGTPLPKLELNETTFRQDKPHCLNFWWKYIKNESCKWYLDTKEQKAVFLVVSMKFTLVSSTRFFTSQIWRVSEIACPKIHAPREKFVRPWCLKLIHSTNNMLFGKLWNVIWKNYCHKWNQRPRICLIANFGNECS